MRLNPVCRRRLLRNGLITLALAFSGVLAPVARPGTDPGQARWESPANSAAVQSLSIVLYSNTLTAESCLPVNDAPDPGETVTYSVSLQNTAGASDTTDLTATLLETDGVISPSGPQSYGVLTAGGEAVARSFTFTIDPSRACGGVVTATLQLQDGVADLGTAAFALTLGKTVTQTTSFANPAVISIPVNAAASPYPSAVAVAGLGGAVTKVTVTLKDLYHAYPSDLQIVLVGPGGQTCRLMSDCGNGTAVGNLDLVFDDAAADSLPNPLTSGTYKPSGELSASLPAPAPGIPYGTTLAVFNGAPANGAWRLFVYDSYPASDAGALYGGWSLSIATTAPVCCGSGGAPVIVADGSTLDAEGCSPPNGKPDPAETVTVSLILRNNGGGATANLVGALQAGGGVTNPSAAQTYGVIAPGASVSKSFFFTVSPSHVCGAPVTATLQLQDGAVNYAAVDFVYPTGTPVGVPPGGYECCPGNCTITSCDATAAPGSGFAPLSVNFSGSAVTTCPGTPIYSWDFGDGGAGSGQTLSHTYVGPGTFNWTMTVSVGGRSCQKTGTVTAAAGTVTIVGAGAALAAEECTPANGAPDPWEMVTFDLSLRNTGTAPTSNLVGTLQASGGVTLPNAPQAYGALVAGGSAVSRSFTCTVDPNIPCGGVITATLILTDGAASYDPVVYTSTVGKYSSGTVTMLSQNFDGVTAPVLPVGWTTAASPGTALWATSFAQRASQPNSAFVPDPAMTTSSVLESPTASITTTNAQLSFRHRYAFENNGYDGGVLEISIDGGAWKDVVAAGGVFTAGGYNGVISPYYGNPLAGRAAWINSQNAFGLVALNLPASLNGHNAQFRWRVGTDSVGGADGWFVDDVLVQTSYSGYQCCTLPCVVDSCDAAVIPAGGVAPLTVNFTGSVNTRHCTGVPAYFWNFGDGNTSTGQSPSHTYTTIGTFAWTMTVTVDGQTGQDSGAVTVTSCAPPVIAQHPQSQTACAGQMVTLSVNATGTGPLHYQWRQGSTPVGSDASTFSTPAPAAGATYTVHVSNTCGTTASNPATVTASQPAVIADAVWNQRVCAGDKASFTLIVTGQEPISYKWYESADGVSYSLIPRAAGTTYTTPNLTAKRFYKATVQNTCGSDERVMTVDVATKPNDIHLSAPDHLLTVRSGQNVAITVTYAGTEPIALQWYEGETGDASKPVEGATSAVFVSPNLYQDTKYWVRLTNECGSVDENAVTVLIMNHYYLPHVAATDTWWSKISVVNAEAAAGAGDDKSTARLYAFNAAGALLESKDISISGLTRFDSEVKDLLSPETLAQDIWLRVDSKAALKGLVEFGTLDDRSQANLPFLEAPAKNLVFPYVVSMLNWYTGLTLVNASWDTPANVKLAAYDEDGARLAEKDETIDPHGKYVRLINGIFGPDVNVAQVRSIGVESSQSLVGFELFGALGDPGLAGLPVVQTDDVRPGGYYYGMFYPEIPDNVDWYTGVTFSNLDAKPATVMAEAYAPDGSRLGTETFLLAPHQQITREVWDLFPPPGYGTMGYFLLSSVERITGFELVLSRTSPFRFDGLPANLQAYRKQVFPVAPADAANPTFIRIINKNNSAMSLTVKAYNATGDLLGTYPLTLDKNAKADVNVGDVFPGGEPTPVYWLLVEGDNIFSAHAFILDGESLVTYLGMPLP